MRGGGEMREDYHLNSILAGEIRRIKGQLR